MRINFVNFSLMVVSLVCVISCSTKAKSVESKTLLEVKSVQDVSPQIDNNQPDIPEERLQKDGLRPAIISRQDWRANNPRGQAKEHSIHFITIHHTATLQRVGVSVEQKMRNLQNFSQSESRLLSGKIKPAWFDIPYHYYIAVDGKIAEGRSIKFVGDTNTDYDPTEHALIVLEGSFENEQVSVQQQKSLEALAAWLSVVYGVRVADIKAHNDYTSTVCPGKNLKSILPMLREKVVEINKSVENN